MRPLNPNAIVTRSLLSLALLVSVLMIAGTDPGQATARQESATPTTGTPVASGLPLTPSAADCTVAPVVFPELPVIGIPEIAMTPPPSQATGGTPADDTLMRAVVETLRIQIGCVNAGDIPRALALAGGDYYTGLFAGLPSLAEGQYETLATPLPRTVDSLITILAVNQVMSYPDNTLTAQVTTEAGPTTVNALRLEPNPNTPTGYMIVQQEQLSRSEPSADPSA